MALLLDSVYVHTADKYPSSGQTTAALSVIANEDRMTQLESPPESTTYTVRDAFYDFMRTCGSRKVFGNPGSTELPMFRRFPDDIEYVLGLQEAVVVGMADGYAQATRNAAFVNLHSAAGVGNAMGNIYTAFKNQTPLVIIAGQQSRSIQSFDPYLFSRQAAELPKPYVKWSIEPSRAEDVPLAIIKAYQMAMQQPRGPVLISVPSDDWDHPCERQPSRQVSRRVGPAPEDIDALLSYLHTSDRIALVVGAAIDRDGAWPEAIELAEACQGAVFVAPMSARCNFPETHPLFQGFLPASDVAIKSALGGFDLVLVVGAPAFTYHIERATEGGHVPAGARLAVLTDDPEVAASVPEGQAIYANVQLGMRALLKGLDRRTRAAPPARPKAPTVAPGEAIHVAYLLQSLAALRKPDDIVVEEAPTARLVMHQYLPIVQPDTFYTMASGGLGFGMPASVGIALAHPKRKVICLIGDGSSMYSIQSLWTAAQHNANVVFIVPNNGGYAAMRRFAGVLGFVPGEKVVGIDVPGIAYDGLAASLGCHSERVTRADEVAGVLSAALERNGPSLIEVVLG
jgi:benzoylformate decarboxylase